jgi:peroxiredoxin
VMVHGRDGRPTLQAMTARLRDLERRDWGEAYAVSKRMTDMYPDSAQSWAIRYSFEVSLFDRDSVLAVHRTQFERLESASSGTRGVDPDAVAWLGLYALALGDLGRGEMWIRKSLNRDPHGHAAIEGQMVLWSHASIGQPKAVLSKLDSLWNSSTPKSKSIANLGWQVATEAHDLESGRKWMERYLYLHPEEALAMAPRAYRMSGGAGTVGDWIEDYVANLRTVDGMRPLGVNEAEYTRQEAERLQVFLATVATDAWRGGDLERAGRLAAAAVGLAWESPALLDLSDVLIAAGHTEAGINALVRAAADPATNEAATMRALEISATHVETWKNNSAAANDHLHDYVMDGAVVRYIDLNLSLKAASGTYSLAKLRGNDATVLAFMSRLCAPAIEQMPRLSTLAGELAKIGAKLLVIDIDNTNQLTAYAQMLDFPLDILVDHTGAARAQIKSSATPDFFVLDSHGRVRFEHSRPDAILRQVASIQADAASGVLSVAD